MIRGAVLGGDVGKSRSPAIHNAAFAALGLEGRYGAFSVEPAGFRRLVRRLFNEGYDYLNVTIPHKKAAAELVDSASALVGQVAAANTLLARRRGHKLTVRAENTDGYGLLAALGDLGVVPQRGEVFVMAGSGGAAAGALAALLGAGAKVRIVARRPPAARALARRFPESVKRRIEVAAWTAQTMAAALDGARALVSAVPAAAWAGEGARGLSGLGRGTAVLEMAYGAPSALASEVRGRVSRYQDGLPMLVHQAARAVELLTGTLPPAEPLLRAARTAAP